MGNFPENCRPFDSVGGPIDGHDPTMIMGHQLHGDREPLSHGDRVPRSRDYRELRSRNDCEP